MTNSLLSQNREAAEILSATNRYTAQHFKAETKRHKSKTMIKKKTIFFYFSIRLFLNYLPEQVVNAHLL